MSAQSSAKPGSPMEGVIRFITHKGKKILFVDVSNCSPEEVAKISAMVPTYVTTQPRGSVLLLGDFTGAQFDRRTIERLKQDTVLDRPYLKRSAWVGTDNMPKVFYEHLKVFSKRDLPTFKTQEEAMDWLVQD